MVRECHFEKGVPKDQSIFIQPLHHKHDSRFLVGRWSDFQRLYRTLSELGDALSPVLYRDAFPPDYVHVAGSG